MKILKLFSYVLVNMFTFILFYYFVLYKPNMNGVLLMYEKQALGQLNAPTIQEWQVLISIIPFLGSLLLLGMYLANDKGSRKFKLILHAIVFSSIFLFIKGVFSSEIDLLSRLFIIMVFCCEIFLFSDFVNTE